MSGISSFNVIDYIILAIFAISVLAGLMRGLVKEIISLITWIAAFVIASYFAADLALAFSGSQHAAQTTEHHISLLSLGLSFVALFVGTLLVGSLLNYFISSAVETGGISFANRFLGGLFGLLRGVLIIFFIIFLAQLAPINNEPVWTGSRFVVAYQPMIKWLNSIVQPGVESLKEKVGTSLKGVDPNQYLDGASKAFKNALPNAE